MNMNDENTTSSRKKFPGFKDCHFFSPVRCAALTSFECKNLGKCKFYKTEKQWREDLKKYPIRQRAEASGVELDCNRLRKELKTQKVTQKDISARLGKSKDFISGALGRGYMAREQLQEVAEILGVDYECLVKKES